MGPESHRSFEVGSQASDRKTITEDELKLFGMLSGDYNPIHYSGITLKDGSKVSVVHGAFLNSLVSGVIGTKLPGPGTVVINQNLRFPQPCFVGEEITTTVQVTSLRKIIEVAFQCIVNVESDSPKIVLEGEAKLVMPKMGKSAERS